MEWEVSTHKYLADDVASSSDFQLVLLESFIVDVKIFLRNSVIDVFDVELSLYSILTFFVGIASVLLVPSSMVILYKK